MNCGRKPIQRNHGTVWRKRQSEVWSAVLPKMEKYVRYSPRVLVILKEPNIINDKDANGDHRPWYQEFTKGRFDRKKKCIIISDSEKRNADIGSHQKELVGI